MSNKSNNNSTLMIFMLFGVSLAMCVCILLGAFLFVGIGVVEPEVAAPPPVAEPNLIPTATIEQSIEVDSSGSTEEVVVDNGTDTSVFDLREGTCFNDPVAEEDLVEELVVVSCDAPHDNEVFGLVGHPGGAGDAFPGDEAISEFADQQCELVYASYVGIAYADSLFYFSTYYPTVDSWGNGDREVICFLYHPDLEKLIGSKKGSNE